ncbi:MAG: PepSY domain-containing protein [Gammaproteobacteria bacterium]
MASDTSFATARPLSERQITERALRGHPGSTVESAKLVNTRHGKKAWEVAIQDQSGKATTVYFDPTTGTRLRVHSKTLPSQANEHKVPAAKAALPNTLEPAIEAPKTH